MKRAEVLARIEQMKLFEVDRSKGPTELAADAEPETICFRAQTISIVRHFFEISSQVPSFEDQAVFVHDIEHCLMKLNADHARMITMVGLYDFTRDEVAAMLRHCRSWVNRRYIEALDALTQIFLDANILSAASPDRKQWQLEQRALPQEPVQLPPKRPCGSVTASAPIATVKPSRRWCSN